MATEPARLSEQLLCGGRLEHDPELACFPVHSLDSVGFVTVDKPPLGFWVQVASAKILGFSGFSILLPEALATVASVALVYHLVRVAFGGGAGLIAGLMLALMPVSVVVGRENTIDSLLVVVPLVAVWTALHATARGSLRWVLATGVVVGLGFEIKMFQAYLIVPALGLVYLLGAPISKRSRIVHLALALAVLLLVSLLWPVAIDLTPPSCGRGSTRPAITRPSRWRSSTTASSDCLARLHHSIGS